MELFKKIAIAVAGVLASYYATKTVKAALERKPLKARVRGARSTVVDMKNNAMDKVHGVKDAAVVKVDEVKQKAARLYDDPTFNNDDKKDPM